MPASLSTFELDPASDLGIAGQIRARVALLIADSALKPGELLPSVRVLAEQLGANVNTVRAAYARLEADGLVRTRHGVGTVVLPASPGQLALTAPQLGSNTVAVLIAGLDPFYLPLLRGIEDEAREHGTLVLMADTRDSPPLAEAVIRRLIARGVDGIIAVSVGGFDNSSSRPKAPSAARASPPIVYVDQPQRKGFAVLFDGEKAGYIAAHHLVDHGHDAVGLVTAPLSWPNANELYAGSLKALRETRRRPLVCEVEEFNVAAGRDGLGRLLQLPDPPSAVFATGEVLALGVLQEARSRGIDVPGDLAIIGYTDSPAAALVEPPLTMVSVPAREMGLRAMSTLQSLMAGRIPSPRHTTLDVELVVRGSCGAHSTLDGS